MEAKEEGRGVMGLNLCFQDLLKEHTGERERLGHILSAYCIQSLRGLSQQYVGSL